MMIEQTVVDGKRGWVAWLKGRMQPCEKDEATFAKVVFDDGGTLWVALTPRTEQAQVVFDPSEPRVQNLQPLLRGRVGSI